MWTDLPERLVCPSCAGSLRAVAFEEEELPVGDGAKESRVREGVLLCDGCRTLYPVAGYVAVLLDFPTSFHEVFQTRYAAALGGLGDYEPPRGEPRPGERDVQRSFTEEWNVVQDDALTFNWDDEDLFRLHRDVWLRWEAKVPPVRQVLNVGCGFGKEAAVLERICPEADVLAVDLNLSILQAGRLYADDRRLQFVVASAFALPFRPASFDLVYSEGVLHHTYSTREAFDCVARHVAPGGHLFVWFYALEDAYTRKGFVGRLKRLYFLAERLLRPVIASLPSPLRQGALRAIAVLLHLPMKRREIHGDIWRFRNTLHAVYDFFGPRYAHRHGWNEVLEWFEAAGFEVTVQSPRRYRELFDKQLHGVGMRGTRPASP